MIGDGHYSKRGSSEMKIIRIGDICRYVKRKFRCLTVPALWNQGHRIQMEEAALKAGKDVEIWEFYSRYDHK